MTLPGGASLVWVVVSRTQGQANPSCSVLGVRTLPFLVSGAQPFTTVTTPPGKAGTGTAAVRSVRPSAVRGFWNEVQLRRPGR
jgi:hypothetical protein